MMLFLQTKQHTNNIMSQTQSLFTHLLKAVDTIVITQHNYYHKPFLITSNGERLILILNSIKTLCEKQLPLKWSSFRERNYFPRIRFRYLRFRTMRSRNQASESTQLRVTRVRQWCFFFHINISQLLSTDWAQIFTGLLFYAYVEKHQVRRLVFDNYQ